MAQDDIQGQVVDAQGNPVDGAIVELTKSYQSSPDSRGNVFRTTTDSNGNYIFEFHPDGDGTTQEWHVSCYNHDGSAYVNSFNNPGVTADLPSNTIPDSAISRFVASESGFTDGQTVTSWPDLIDGNDLDGRGTPVLDANSLNGVDAVDNNNDSWFEWTGSTVSAPCTFIWGLRVNAQSDNDHLLLVQSSNAPAGDGIQLDNSGYQVRWGGTNNFGSSVIIGDQILAFTVDTSGNAELRVNGSLNVTNSGSTEMLVDGCDLFNDSRSSGRIPDVSIGEMVVYDDVLSNAELQSEEQRINDQLAMSVV